MIFGHRTNRPEDTADRKSAEAALPGRYDVLHQHHKALEILFENMPYIITWTDLEGVCQYISPSVQAILGYAPEELIGKTTSSLYHPDDWREIKSRPLSDLNFLTYRIRHNEGHYVWMETTAKCLYGIDGKLEKYVGIGRDITEKKALEDALRKSEENLKFAQKIARIGSWEWDIVLDTVRWSDEMYALFEIEPEDFVETVHRVGPFIHPEDQERFRQAIRSAFDGGEQSIVCKALCNGSGVKHLKIQGVVSCDGKGKPVKMHGTVQDISERIESERVLEETVERFTSLMKYNPDAVLSIDTNGRFISGNKAAERMTGYSAEELSGMHISALVCDDCMDLAIERFQAAVSGRSLDDMPLTIRNKQGQPVYLIVTPAPIVVHRQIVGCYMIAKDVTEQKKKDEFIIQSEKQTIAGQLAAAIAHEIRNPLTAIKGFLKLMDTSGFKKEYIDILGQEFSRIETITNELLLLAKPQASKMEPKEIGHMLGHVTTLLETQANMNNVSLVRAFEVEALTVYCDENQIKQVMINIIKNAIEAMSGGGEVTVTSRREAGFAAVSIQDQGCGIPAELIAKIGQPFYSTKEKGTGLGLMVSYKIVENHGGSITVDSEVGKGTTFKLLLPLFRDGKDSGDGLSGN